MPIPTRSPGSRPSSCLWAFFLLFGLFLFAVILWLVIVPMMRAAWWYVETDCVVLDKRLVESRGNKGGTTYRPDIRIRYHAANREHDLWTYDAARISTNNRAGQQAILDQFQVGQHYRCWYDPANPGQAVLTHELSWFMLVALFPLLFIGLGAGGLIVNWRSRPAAPENGSTQAEPPLPAASQSSELAPARRLGCLLAGFFLVCAFASMALSIGLGILGAPFWMIQISFFAPFGGFMLLFALLYKRLKASMDRAQPSPEQVAAQQLQLPPPGADPVAEARFPAIPPLDLASHPGTTLAYQLPSSTNSACLLLVALGVTCFWNGIVSIFVWIALFGDGGWWLRIFLIPFVLVGTGMIFWTLLAGLQLISATLLGRVSLEIAEHPLMPGSQVELLLEQGGMARLAQVGLTLTCTESATFQQGTSTRTETHEVSKTVLVDPETSNFDGRLNVTLTVPSEAMHSFESAHNKIYWKLTLGGRVLGLLPYSSEFPLVVRPE